MKENDWVVIDVAAGPSNVAAGPSKKNFRKRPKKLEKAASGLGSHPMPLAENKSY